MRVVAVGALVVGFHAVIAEHQHVVVAVPAGHGLAFLEVVRSVTTGALGVSFEEGGFWDPWMLGLVTGGAGFARLGSGRVLMRVAGGAGRDDVLAGGRMRGADLVAIAARRRDWFFLFVGSMARKTLLRVVHAHCGSVALIHQMAARAVAGREGLDGSLVGSVFRQLDAESVAIPAVGGCRRTERFARLVDGVLELAFFLVTVRAALRHDRTDFGVGELVALVARDLFQHHVLVMTIDGAGGLPLLGDVHALPVNRPGSCLGRTGHQRGHHDRECQHEGKRPFVEQGAAMIVGPGKKAVSSVFPPRVPKARR